MASCEFCVVGGKSGGFLFPSLKCWHHTVHVKQGRKVEKYKVHYELLFGQQKTSYNKSK